jgi:hypothetical protein
MNVERIILHRSTLTNIFGGIAFLWFCILSVIFISFSSFPSLKFFILLIIAITTGYLGISFLTSPTWSYIDKAKKAVIQEGRFLIFFPMTENDVFVELKYIRSVKLKIEALPHGYKFTPIIYDYDRKRYELDSTQRKRVAFKIVEKIRKAVLEETGTEPEVYLPTKKQIKSLT